MAARAGGELTGDGCEGLLLVDKPAGLTSHDVVDRVRGGCNLRLVGQA